MKKLLFYFVIVLLCISCGNSNNRSSKAKASVIEEWMVGEWDLEGELITGKLVITSSDFSFYDFDSPQRDILNAQFKLNQDTLNISHPWLTILADKEHHCFNAYEDTDGGIKEHQMNKKRPGKGNPIPYAEPWWFYIDENGSLEHPTLVKISRKGAAYVEGVKKPASIDEAESLIKNKEPHRFLYDDEFDYLQINDGDNTIAITEIGDYRLFN